MNSRICAGRVFHRREAPVPHQFAYPVFFLIVDLDELPELDRTVRGFGYNRFSLLRVDDADFLRRGRDPLRQKVRDILAEYGVDEPMARIELVTFGRLLNGVFRPASFFLCYGVDGVCQTILTEVHNTFGETHLYVPVLPVPQPGGLRFHIPKDFHVSPFFSREGTYEFRFLRRDGRLELVIDLQHGERVVFRATLRGEEQPLTTGNLWRTLARYPLNAWLHFPRILAQAAVIYYRKKLPLFSKPVPRSPRTMRKQCPSWLDRSCQKRLTAYLDSNPAGQLTLTLPEGEKQILGPADTGRSAELRVHEYRFFRRVALGGDTGLGEAYEQGFWSTPDLTGLLSFLLTAILDHPVPETPLSRLAQWPSRLAHRRRANTLRQAPRNIAGHYDLSNGLYKLFLDETLSYSCAIFERAGEPLETAQLRKIDRVLDKARLEPEHHLLEIGTGWGSLAIRAAERVGCRVTTLTISEAQYQLAVQRIRERGLQDRITVKLCDYRQETGQYDRLVSVEMLEAVGHAHLPEFCRCCDRFLKPNGVGVLQTITIPCQRYKQYTRQIDWIRLYIFPGGHLPCLTALAEAFTRYTSLNITGVESIGPHYAPTLARWREALLAKRDAVLDLGFPESFIRRWEYYFSYCEAGFQQQYLDDLQLIITRPRNRDLIRSYARLMESPVKKARPPEV